MGQGLSFFAAVWEIYQRPRHQAIVQVPRGSSQVVQVSCWIRLEQKLEPETLKSRFLDGLSGIYFEFCFESSPDFSIGEFRLLSSKCQEFGVIAMIYASRLPATHLQALSDHIATGFRD